MAQESMRAQHVARPGDKFRLKDVDSDGKGKYKDKSEAKPDLNADRAEIGRLQEVLYAENKHALLIVVQAMDCGGKDGTLKHVMGSVNPQGCQVTSFKTPSAVELSHDYLWRVHAVVPPKRMIGVFNRSHYEDVLVVRVHNLVPPEVWSQRYEQINQFEKHLTECGVTILKFFLHISKAEQKLRLEERIKDPTKQWKFSMGDLKERDLWDNYMQAYEDMVNLTSTKWAPWYVVPANRNWYRNLVIGRIIAETLRDFKMSYPKPADDLSGVVVPD